MKYNDKEINLTEGMVIKNYKELCAIMGEPVVTSNSKTAQINNWKRYFNFIKEGNKYIITEIYDKPFPSDDARKHREGLYLKYIECLLMDMIANSTNRSFSGKKQIIIPKNRLYVYLGMANERYSKFYGREGALISIIEEIENAGLEADDKDAIEDKLALALSFHDVSQFYQISGSRLNNILKTALNSMKTRKLIDYNRSYIVVYNDNKNNSIEENILDDFDETGTRKLADIDELQIILDIQRQALLEMGFYDVKEVVSKKCYKEYQATVELITHERCPEWKFFYPVFYLVHSNDFKDQLPLQTEEIKKMTLEQQRLELNSKICKTLEQSAEKKYLKNQKEYQDYLNVPEGWGDPNPMEKPYVLKDNYVQNQKKLIDYTIKIEKEEEKEPTNNNEKKKEDEEAQ